MSETKSWFDITINRGPITGALRNTVGLIVHVRADSAVEEFFRSQSADAKLTVDQYGQSWVPVEKGQVVEAYRVSKMPSNQFSLGRYTLDQVSRPLLTNNRGNSIEEGGALNTVNLSFFKLVGISSEAGVKFGVVGAFSLEYISNLNRQLIVEAKQFLMDYIAPVNVKLRVTSK